MTIEQLTQENAKLKSLLRKIDLDLRSALMTSSDIIQATRGVLDDHRKLFDGTGSGPAKEKRVRRSKYDV